MRKYLLLPAIILQTTLLFGQTSADWSSWITHDCYKGIKYKIANWGKVSGNYSDNYWGIMFENTYSQPVSFSYHLSVGGENPPTDYNYTVTYKIQPGGIYSNDATKATAILFKSNSPNYGVYIKDVCLGDCENKNYINCQGIKQNSTITTNYSNSNSTSNTNTNSTNNNSSSSNNTQQNDLTEYNNSKADLEKQMQQKNQEIASQNAEAQRQQQLLKQQQEQQKQQKLQQGINQITTETVNLISYFANRKNALRNSLSQEDAQALLDIVNSENPTDYTQNVIQIFTDLGYTLRKSETKDGVAYITLNNDVANINDLLFVFIYPASYDFYNRISFDYYRKQKLLEQLSSLGNNLKDKGNNGFEIEGISASNQQKKIEKDEKTFSEKNKRINDLIERFDKYYLNEYVANPIAYDYAVEIAESYEDEKSLNNISEAIRYYKKAVTFMPIIPLDSLTATWKNKNDKDMVASRQIKYSKVCFKLAYLLDQETGQNGQEAIEYYLMSASIHSIALITANNNIAKIYKFGKGGVTKDWNLAKEYFEKAANEGDAVAMVNLATLYNTGGPNLEKDEEKSKKWFKKACKEDKKYCY